MANLFVWLYRTEIRKKRNLEKGLMVRAAEDTEEIDGILRRIEDAKEELREIADAEEENTQ